MDSIKSNLSELITAAFGSEDSVTILVAFASILAIGWIMRYLWDRIKIKALRETNEKAGRERDHFKSQWNTLQDKHALQEADLKKATLSLAEKTTSLETVEAEKRTLGSRLNATLVDLDTSKEEVQEVSSRMEDLNDQILGLRTKNAQLNTEMEQKATIAGNYAISQDENTLQQKQKQKQADLIAENSFLKNSLATLKAGAIATGTAGAALRVSKLEEENETLKTQLEEANNSTLAATDTSEEVAALRSRLVELESEKEKLADSLAEIAQLEAGNEALNLSVQSLIEENEELQANSDTITQYEAGNEVLNTTIANLLAEKAALEEQLADTTNNLVEWAVNDEKLGVIDVDQADSSALEVGGVVEVDQPDSEDLNVESVINIGEADSEELDVEAAKAKFKTAIGNQIPMATAADRDDLKQINGIGPFIEEKLNDLGIYTFEQVGSLDEGMVEDLTTAIEFFPGRIERDDWVGQADRLFYMNRNVAPEMNDTSAKMITRRYATATEKIETTPRSVANPVPNIATDPVPEPATKPSPNLARSVTGSVKPDDLKKIEGIGPKIASILNEAGIYTFHNLSQTPVDRLKGILASAGNRYKIHNPSTWPEQSALAAGGEWDRLKQLQDQLDGGRNVAKG